MWARGWRPASLALAAAVPLVCYLRTMPPTITWWLGGSDSGDLASAAAALGIPHPTGYPLFVLLGFAATHLPLPPADPAGRINLMNGVIGAGGSALVAATVWARAPRDARPRQVAGAATLAALGIALSTFYWSQAIIAEVYALQAALTALVLWLWARPETPPVLRGAAHGLTLTNHATAVILLAAALITRRETRTRAFALGTVAPLLLYALLPLRAAQDPIANWGEPRTPARFVAHVTGRQYQGRLNLSDPGTALVTLSRLLRSIAGDLPLWMLPAAVVGLAHAWRTRPADTHMQALAGGGAVAFAAVYDVPDRAPYLIPTVIVLGVWSGGGLLAVARLATRPWQTLAGGAMAAALLIVTAVQAATAVNLRGDDSALRFARATLAALPPDATYYTARDDVLFALWYAQRTLGLRRDVRVVDIRNPSLRGVR